MQNDERTFKVTIERLLTGQRPFVYVNPPVEVQTGSPFYTRIHISALPLKRKSLFQVLHFLLSVEDYVYSGSDDFQK